MRQSLTHLLSCHRDASHPDWVWWQSHLQSVHLPVRELLFFHLLHRVLQRSLCWLPWQLHTNSATAQWGCKQKLSPMCHVHNSVCVYKPCLIALLSLVQCRGVPDWTGSAAGSNHDWQTDHQQCPGDLCAQDEGLVAEEAGKYGDTQYVEEIEEGKIQCDCIIPLVTEWPVSSEGVI